MENWFFSLLCIFGGIFIRSDQQLDLFAIVIRPSTIQGVVARVISKSDERKPVFLKIPSQYRHRDYHQKRSMHVDKSLKSWSLGYNYVKNYPK